MKQKKVRGTFTRTRRILTAILCGCVLTSCQMVRTITTTAETRQEDDKTIIIQTKTIESYTGEKK